MERAHRNELSSLRFWPKCNSYRLPLDVPHQVTRRMKRAHRNELSPLRLCLPGTVVESCKTGQYPELAPTNGKNSNRRLWFVSLRVNREGNKWRSIFTFNRWHVAFVATADGQVFKEQGCEVKLVQICDESRLQTVVIRCIFSRVKREHRNCRLFPFTKRTARVMPRGDSHSLCNCIQAR